jgi:hypothetical protein
MFENNQSKKKTKNKKKKNIYIYSKLSVDSKRRVAAKTDARRFRSIIPQKKNWDENTTLKF